MTKDLVLKTISEVAPIIHCSPFTVRKMIKNKQIPYRKIGGRYLFTPEDIQEYLDLSKVTMDNKSSVNIA